MQMLQDLKSQYLSIKNATDPNTMLQQFVNNNPGARNAMDYINNSFNGNGEQALRSVAKAKGMTDQQIDEYIKQCRTTFS